MGNAVTEYRMRRRKRLDEKAVSLFKMRRDERLLSRFDDEEESNNNKGGKSGGGGHGNTRIPFGLCQREGIKIDPDWTPQDAWEALSDKGYSAGEVYKRLKETGKVGGKSEKTSKAKKPPTKITESAFPDAMLGRTHKKNTMIAADYVSEHCDDGNITEFLSSATGAGATDTGPLKCRRIKSGEGCAVTPIWNALTEELVGAQIDIPMFSAFEDEQERAAAIRSFVHEWTHYIDMRARDGMKRGSFSGRHKELNELLDKETEIKIGDDVRKVFTEFDEKFENEYKRFKEEYDNVWKGVLDKMYGENVPDWIDKKTGSLQGGAYWYHYDEAVAYTKEREKARKEAAIRSAKRRRAMMDGATSLQGIYDAIYEGKCRSQKIVRYGHRESYYRNKENRAMELLADYVALKATNPKLAQLFIDDKPEIAASLDNMIEEMTKKLRGGV